MASRARDLTAIVLVAIAACGPIDTPLGQISDEAAGPSVLLTDAHPRARATFTVSVNDAARMDSGTPGFTVESDQLDLAGRGEPAMPVDIVILHPASGSHPIELHRGRCEGERCVGTFEIVFSRSPGASGATSFRWSVSAVVNFDTDKVPDGAAVDVAFR